MHTNTRKSYSLTRLLLLVAAITSQSRASPREPCVGSRQDNSIPSVDLGYEVHTATENVTGQYYIFSNIPYAEQPVGDLRFQQVSLPTGNSSAVNNGSTDLLCHQAAPSWVLSQEAATDNISLALIEEYVYSEAGQTEACLVLDLYVPTGVFNSNGSSSSSSSKAPVFIWIHGGGFVSGSKTADNTPAGLLARSTLNSSEGIIVVSINYRLGLFGWLAGAGELTANLGLHDQRVAFEWVQKYVGLFGGDPERITIAGESAGAASVLHHITSYGGGDGDGESTTLPFSRALVQSPAFQTSLNPAEGYARTLAEASNYTGSNITSPSALTSLGESDLHAINFYTVLAAQEGSFIYGPVPDGTYVPALPQVLLYEGRFHRGVEVMAAHNSLEAATFMSTSITTGADVRAHVAATFPRASNATLGYLLGELYPPGDYASEFLRAVQITSDAEFSCSTRFLALAFGNETYNYLFAYPPGYHAEDTSYTWFNGDTSTLDDGYPVNATLAYALQDYIVGFTMAGNPNESPAGTALEFPMYGSGSTVVKFASTGLLATQDDMDNDRCPWWQRAMAQGLV